MIPLLVNLIKLLVAMMCGSLIGMGMSGKESIFAPGSYILLALGSCLVLVVSSQFPFSNPEHVLLIMSFGLSLWAGGMAIGRKGTLSRRGEATASWISGIAGLAVGAGLFWEAMAVTFATYFILSHTRNIAGDL